MTGVALKGLAARKVRALLTAFAVVIGVAMVAGTFMLTDTLQKSFSGLFSDSNGQTDAVVRGKEVVKDSTSGSGVTIPASVLTEIRPLPEVGAASGDVNPQEANVADIYNRDGKKAAKESVGASIDPANAALSPLKLRSGAWPRGPGEVAIRRRHRRRRALRRRQPDRHRDARPEAHLPRHRHGLVRQRRLARLREHRRVGRTHRPVPAEPRGPLRLGLDRREEGQLGGRRRPRREAAPRTEPRGEGREEAGRRGRRQPERRPAHDPAVPPRLRLHRPARRRVRHLQHAVDHGRAAHA
jgi:MacB-like periplasmic core domain